MKSVILCLMTVLYIANAEQYNLKELVIQIKQSKQNVQNDIQELIVFRDRIDLNADSYIKTQRNTQMWQFVRESDQMINEICNETVTAIEEGKDAQRSILCYNAAFDDLKKLKTTVIPDSEQCMTTAGKAIEIKFTNLNNLIKTGNDVKTQLDGVLSSCRTSNDTEPCLITKLGQVNTDLGTWRDKIKPTKDALDFAYTEIVTLKYSSCISKIFSPASLDIEWTWKIATSCIGFVPSRHINF